MIFFLSIAVSVTLIENICLSHDNNDLTLPGTGQDSKSGWMDFLKGGSVRLDRGWIPGKLFRRVPHQESQFLTSVRSMVQN
jgi:hypothetical protein